MCNHESSGCAKSRQDQAFCEKLLHEPASTRAGGKPNGHFMASRDRSDQKQIADIRARDEQDKNDHR
jgi:hypothetical protein